MVEARRDRGLVAEVARQRDDPHAAVVARDLGEDLRRRVRRAVVDDDQLPRQAVDGRADALVERARRPLLVEHRRDDAQQGQMPVGHGVIVLVLPRRQIAYLSRASRDIARYLAPRDLLRRMRGLRARPAPQGGRRRRPRRPDPDDRPLRHRARRHRPLPVLRAPPDRPDARRRGARERLRRRRLGGLRRRGGRPARDRAARAGAHRGEPDAGADPADERRPAAPHAAGPRLLGRLPALRGRGARLGRHRRRAVGVRLGVRARPPRPRRAHGRPLRDRAAARALRRDRHGRRHRAPAAPRRGAGPDGRAAAPRRDRLDGAARRRQPRRARDARALVVGDPDPRAVLHAPLAAHAARAPRLEVLEIETAPKAFSVRYYLERVGGYSPAAGAAARARRAGGAARRPHVGAGLPRPHGGHRAGAVAAARPDGED